MQNSRYVKLESTADWQRRSRSKDGDQDCHRSRVADRIQTADTVESAAQYLREARGYRHSGYQSEKDGPRESPQHRGKYLGAIGPEREPDRDFFGPLRHGVAYETEKAHDCEKDSNAAQRTDDRRELFHLGDILAEAGCERGNGWIESSVDAACNRLDGWRESVRIASRPDQD